MLNAYSRSADEKHSRHWSRRKCRPQCVLESKSQQRRTLTSSHGLGCRSSEFRQNAQESRREYFFPTPRQSQRASTNSLHCRGGTKPDSEVSQCPYLRMTLPSCARFVNSIIHAGSAHEKEREACSVPRRIARALSNIGSGSTGTKESKPTLSPRNIFREETTASCLSGAAVDW